MDILKQLLIITGICLFGEAISIMLPFTFPGSVISMLAVFILLYLKFLKETQIKKVADFLLQNMSFFFVPAATAIINEFKILKTDILILILIAMMSTIITMLATYYTVCFVSKMTGRGKE